MYGDGEIFFFVAKPSP
uniref:Uncharacterized protein n=1 Tax=Arundo donax TaxID=35708 RepID=A0A0A8ZZ91_ARUDO